MSNKVRVLERQFQVPHAATSFLEQYPNPTHVVLTFLDSQEICRVTSCSKALRQQTNAPSLWKTVASTFLIPDTFWKDRSKNEVRQNLLLLRRVNGAFAECCRKDLPPGLDGETLRQKVVRFTGRQNLDSPLQSTTARFLSHTRPMVQAMCQTAEPSAALHEMLMYNQAYGARFLEMFYASGHRGTSKTMNYMSGSALYCPQVRKDAMPNPQDVVRARFSCILSPDLIHSHVNFGQLISLANISDATLSLDAVELMRKHGELPETISPLLIEYGIRPSQRLAKIIGFFICKGSIPRDLTLSKYLEFGPASFAKHFMEKSGVKVEPTDLSLFLYRARFDARKGAIVIGNINNFVPWTLEMIDLLHSKQPDVRRVPWYPDNRMYDNFGALGCSDHTLVPVLEKLVAVGLGPLNDPDPRSNSIATVLKHKTSYERIALMVSLGARPPNNYEELVQKYYSDQPQVQEQLLKLFSANR